MMYSQSSGLGLLQTLRHMCITQSIRLSWSSLLPKCYTKLQHKPTVFSNIHIANNPLEVGEWEGLARQP